MMNIAIIEDDNGLNNGIALALKNETYHFLQYASLEEAKKAKLDRDADLIILDINLPDGNGFPFSLMVLRARIEKVLQREKAHKKDAYEIDGLLFDFEQMHFRKDGQEIELSKTEQKLLRMLVENRGVTLSRAKLVDAIWTDGAEYVDENALSVAIKRLRNKIEVTPSKPKYIQTVYGIGYVWREGE